MEWPIWMPVTLLSLVVRIPLSLLPGPGRDESAYYYWARQAEAGYAPLMLAAVRILEALGLPALASLRIPSLAGGVACIILFDRFLETAKVARSARLVALLALALNPWQVLVGSVLHPDTLFLSALLALSLALRFRRPMWAAVWGAAAALAKPTGIIVLPLVAVWLWYIGSTRNRYPAIALLLIVAAPAVLWLTPSMIREISEFGHLDPALTPGGRAGLALGSLALEGGLLLPLAAVLGLGDWIERLRRGNQHPDLPILLLALSLITFFLAAAVVNGQVKGSWFLPALVLLWPSRPLRFPRIAVPVLVIIPALVSVIMVGAMRHPALSTRLESSLGLNQLYRLRAGTREQRVSATRTFSERFLEFQDQTALGEAALRQWQDFTGTTGPPDWIVSDDYGLAAQLAYYWRSHEPRLLIPSDGLFNRHADDLARGHIGKVLVVAVQTPLTDIWADMGSIRKIGDLKHPVTGGVIGLGVFSEATDQVRAE